MVLTAAQRSKKYRDKLKQKQAKYNESKQKDLQRKIKKRASMTNERKEKYFDHHRQAQQRYRDKLKLKNMNEIPSDSSYKTKQTLSKAVKKVLHVLPKNSSKQIQVLQCVGQNLGILPKPKAIRTAPQIQSSIVKKIQDFFVLDSISWQAPGKRDTKTVKENGVKVKYQKRHLLYNIREVYELFMEQNPDVSISRSSFAKLRPPYVLYKRTLAHRVCVCIIHENIKLLLDALFNEINGMKNNLSKYTSKMVCDEDDEDCMKSHCANCKQNFAQCIMANIVDKEKIIEWYQWTNVLGRAEKENFSGTVFQCVKKLQQKTPQYLWHVFVKRQQSNYFEYIKENANDGTVVCQIDYSENFTLETQNQVQSAHWSKKQVSIFTAYAWMGGSGGEGYSFGLVSNSTEHNKFSVITCLETLLEEITSIIPDVDEIIFFSDGAASQFKNRYIIKHLTTMMDKFDINFSWNYFASSHGKGVVDSIGGTLKRLVWMEIMAGARCTSAQEFVDICKKKTKTIIVGLVQQAQFDITRMILEKSFEKAPAIPNIRQQHHINVLHKDVIEYALYASRKDKYVYRL